MSKPTVLVVESDNEERRRISTWLDEAGYDDVMICPGPGEPDYTCLGGRGYSCPLSKTADIVVVDLHLRSDEMMTGTPGWQLMLYYFEQGKRIIAINGDEDAVHPWSDEDIRVVQRPLEREPFLSALRAFSHPVYAIGR